MWYGEEWSLVSSKRTKEDAICNDERIAISSTYAFITTNAPRRGLGTETNDEVKFSILRGSNPGSLCARQRPLSYSDGQKYLNLRHKTLVQVNKHKQGHLVLQIYNTIKQIRRTMKVCNVLVVPDRWMCTQSDRLICTVPENLTWIQVPERFTYTVPQRLTCILPDRLSYIVLRG